MEKFLYKKLEHNIYSVETVKTNKKPVDSDKIYSQIFYRKNFVDFKYYYGEMIQIGSKNLVRSINNIKYESMIGKCSNGLEFFLVKLLFFNVDFADLKEILGRFKKNQQVQWLSWLMAKHSSEKHASEIFIPLNGQIIFSDFVDFNIIRANLIKKSAPIMNFKFLNKIGQGGFGAVYKVQHKITNQFAALKCLELKNYSRFKMCFDEINIMEQIHHPNLVQLYCTYYQDPDKGFIVMEYLEGGTLSQLITKFVLNELQISFIVKDVLKGLDYLHWKVFD